MKLARFKANDEVFSGRLIQDELITESERHFRVGDVKLLPPCIPTKIVAVGLNYRDHAAEMNLPLPDEPIIFLKPATSIIGPGDEILLPAQSSRVDFEAELAIVIGKEARNIAEADAHHYILGYTCLNDVTARDLQQKDGQWTRAKSFDTFCPIGPWIETSVDPSDLEIQLLLNGTKKQWSRTSNLIFNCFEIVEFVSSVMTLMPGDVIATGTTSGIGPMKAGDAVEVRIEGIGSLLNTVRSIQ